MAETAQTEAHRKVAELLTESTGTIPTPGFTIKTFKTRGNDPSSTSIHKVFLNVCASPTIPPPPAWSPPPPSTPSYVLDYLKPPCQGTSNLSESDRAKAEEFLAIPLYFSQPRSDEDHQGQPCTVMDVIIFPEALILAQDARPFKSFLIHLVLDQASTVLNDALDPHFKLPKMRSKGTPAPFTWPQIQSRDPQQGVARPGMTMQLEEIPDELVGPLDLSNYSVSYLKSPTVDYAQVCLQLDESLAKRLRQDPRLLHLSVSGYGDQLELAVHARPDSPDPIAKQTIPVCLGIDVKNSTAVVDSDKKTVTIRLCLCSYRSLNWV